MQTNLSSPSLHGKVAVVTGGGGGLCSVFAKALAAHGAKVAVLDLNAATAEKIAAEICAAGGMAIGVPANVLEGASLDAAERTVSEKLGPCDILLNGAGGNHPKGTTFEERLTLETLQKMDPQQVSFFDLTPEGVRFVFDLNFMGTLLPTQVFARGMAERGHGVIVNVSSMNAFRPLTKIPAYSAAKAAVSNFTQWLAVHLAGVNIRVNAIAPGFFVTDQNRALLLQPDGAPTARAGKILAQTPLGRFGEPEELIGTLLWLVDDRASGFVTGTVIPVDGGFSAYSGV